MLQPGGLLFRIKNLAKLAIFTILVIGVGGCILLLPMLWPVDQQNVIGAYQSVLENGTPGLPDGGSEILELMADGTCKQEIELKDGRTFSARGTWEWDADKRYPGKKVILEGVYWVIRDGGTNPRINPDLEKSIKDVVSSHSVGRTLTGRVMLGSDEGPHYEKK
jgi:hypothetical protein